MQTPNSWMEEAGFWFLHSGIQSPEGGVARYYRRDTAENARVSTEITGYACSTLVYLHSVLGDEAYLEAALRAGRFLTRSAWDGRLGLFPFETGAAPGLAYFFDCGIILRGLLALWRVTRDREFLDCSLACGRSMATDFAAGGGFHAILSLPSKRPVPPAAQWSRGPGCYQLKAAMGWLELAEAAGEESFRGHYETALETALASHSWFPEGEAGRERVMDRLHAYCYFLEGLLPAAGRAECAGALAEGIGRAGRLLRETAPLFERSDVYAQLLRVRLLADAQGSVPLDAGAAREELLPISSFQADSADPRLRGGYQFGRKGSEYLPHMNPVSTAFCVQASDMWRRYSSGALNMTWRDLI